MEALKSFFRVFCKCFFLGTAIFIIFCSGTAEFPDKIYQDDTCAFCNMVISDPEFAAQCKTAKEGILKFDDISCLVEYIKKNQLMDNLPQSAVIDYVSKEWLNFEKAVFIKSNTITTPMMSGIVAFSNEADAKKHIKNSNEKLMKTGGLLKMENLYED